MDRGPTLMMLEIVLITLATTSTFVRVGVRAIHHQLGWDDAAIGIAILSSLIAISFSMVGLSLGDGRHMESLDPETSQKIVKWTLGDEIPTFVTLCSLKTSICLFILRIKSTSWLRRTLWAVIAGLFITNGACIVVLLARCQPLRASWDPRAGACWNVQVFNGFLYAQVGYSVLTDLTCSLLPILILWNVKISMLLKVATCGLMSLGLIATGCGAARAALAFNNGSTDLTWSLIPLKEWSFAEANLGILAANFAISRTVYLLIRSCLRRRTDEARPPYQYRVTSSRTFKARNQVSIFDAIVSAVGGQQRGTQSTDESPMVLADIGIRKTTDIYIIQEGSGQQI